MNFGNILSNIWFYCIIGCSKHDIKMSHNRMVKISVTNFLMKYRMKKKYCMGRTNEKL